LPGVLTLLSFPYQAYHDPIVYSKWIMPLLYSKKWRKEKYVDNDGNETEKTNEDICLMELLELRKNNPANFAGLIGIIMTILIVNGIFLYFVLDQY
jgi:hypothetical protein